VVLESFLRALESAPDLTTDQRRQVEDALRGQIERGRSVHEGLVVADDDLAALFGAAALADCATLIAALEAVPADEVVLAIACGRRDDAAIARFTELYMQDIPAMVRRVGSPRIDPGEVFSRVSEALFVSQSGGRPRILDLVGRGSLSGLVRVIAVRTTINLSRREHREITDPHDALATAIASQTDPELATIKKDHRDAIKAALEQAIGALLPDERNLLRLSLLHRLTIDEIASLQQVHRSTAARRIARIRDQLGKDARRRLRAQLGVGGDDLEQIFRVVSSSVDISFARLLGP
jgi:RNA polymerase sigma-70 factor (ECF subfamily)